MAAAIQLEEIPPARKHTESATAEFDLLCACCGPSGSPAITNALRADISWERVFQLASRHRLLPCLYSALRGHAGVPGSIQVALDLRFSSHVRRVLRFSAELVGILRQFESLGIKAILQKGPALALRLYGDPAMREFGDLDFLVRVEDISRARAALIGLGFRPHLVLSVRQERAYLNTGYEHAFASSLGPNVVELQWQIVPRFYAIAFRPEELFRQSVEIEFEGLRGRILCNEDLLLTLSAHAAKHCWSQLGMVRDLATLVREPLDWDRVIAEAKRLGIIRILTISLVLCRNLLGMGFPPEVAAGAELRRSEIIADDVREQMMLATELNTESLNYFRFMMRLREQRRHRVQFATRLAFTPGGSEWNAIHLPDRLFPLYRGVRLLRLLQRAF